MKDELEKLFRHWAVFVVGLIFQRAARLFLLPLYWSVFPPALFGLLELFEVFVMVMALAFAFALPSTYIKFSRIDAHEGLSPEALRGTTAVLSLVGLFLLGAVLTAFRVPLSWVFFKGTYPRLYWLAEAAIVAYIGFLMVQSTLRAHGRAVVFVLLSSLQFVLLMALNVYFIKWRGMAIDGVLLSLILGWGTPALIYAVVTVPGLRWRFDLAVARRLLRFALPLVPFALASFLMTISGRLFLQHFHGPEAVGIFSAANRVALVMMLICVTPFQTAWGYLGLDFTRGQNAPVIFARTFSYLLLLGLWVFLLVSALGRQMIVLFATAEYLPALPYVDILTAGYLMQMFFYWANIALIGRAMTVRIFLLCLPAFAIAVGGGWVAVPRFGIAAASVLFLAAMTVHAVVTSLYSRKLVSFRLEKVRLLKILFAFAAAYWLGQTLMNAVPSAQLLIALAELAAFPVLLWLLRFATRGEVERLRELRSYVARILTVER